MSTNKPSIDCSVILRIVSVILRKYCTFQLLYIEIVACQALTLSCLPPFLCPGWSNFTWIKAITMKCTYLYNHAICFNQTLHKLGKQSQLSIDTDKVDDFWPTSRSHDPIWPPDQGSKLTLASLHFASEFHLTASAKLYHTHFSATRTLALIIHESHKNSVNELKCQPRIIL